MQKWMNCLFCSAVSKYLSHFPEGLIEFHILIDALDCPALGHPATIRAATGTVTLTTANEFSWTQFNVIKRSLAPSP
jgi:hypothetical protein